MPALMNTNFPFRSIHQHIKLHFVSFCLFRCFLLSRCVYLLIYFIDELLLIYLNGNSKMWVLFTHESLAASQWTQQLTQKVTLNSAQSLLWLSMNPESFELFAFIYFFILITLFFSFRPICGRTMKRWWRGWRGSWLKKKARDLLSTRTSSTSAEITSSSRYAGG